MLHSPLTDKVYIGQTRQTPARRWSQHLNSARNAIEAQVFPQVIYRAMNTHDINTWDMTVLGEFKTKEDLDAAETRWIKEYHSLGLSYNTAKGGSGVAVEYTPEQKALMSAATSKRQLGEGNHQYGKPISEATKAKIRATKQIYPPELVASFDSPKAAREALGMGKNQYSRIKRANPDLDWPK